MPLNRRIFIPRYISDVNYNPTRVNPHIYFYNGQAQCEPWFIEGYSGSATTSSANISIQSIDTFPQLDYYSGQEVTSQSLSLLFNNESTPYGTFPSNSLYSEYWSNYINFLYDEKTRVVTCTAIIPLADYFKMNLNDVVEWRGNYYYLRAINDYNTSNGECNLQLIGPIIDDTLTLTQITSTTTSTTSTTTSGPTTTSTTSTSTTSTSTTSTSTTSTTTAAPLPIVSDGIVLWNRCSGLSGNTWLDSSGNGNNALVSGSIPLSLSGSLGVEFVSSSSNPTYLTYPSSLVATPSSSFTLQFYGSPKGNVGDMTLFGKSSPSASVYSDGWFTSWNGNTGGTARMYYYDKFTEEVVAPSGVAEATRSLFTFVFNEGTTSPTLYVNNDVSYSFTSGPIVGFNTASSVPFTFGYDANGGSPNFGSYVGTVTDIMVYNKALSQSEINQNYFYITSQSCTIPSTTTSTTSTSTSTSTTTAAPTTTSTTTSGPTTTSTSTTSTTSTTTSGPTTTSTSTTTSGPTTSTTTLSNTCISASGGITGTFISGLTEYKYHMFTSSADFTIASGNRNDVQIMVVAGGGAGGLGGGGGAGGLNYSAANSLSAGTYNIKVGNGGIPATIYTSPSSSFAVSYPTNGETSSVSCSAFVISANGGGYGGTQYRSGITIPSKWNQYATPANTGGAGGGASGDANASAVYKIAGSGIEGYQGSNFGGANYPYGGGGGYSSAAPYNTELGGTGIELGTIMKGVATYYAGGGAGVNRTTGNSAGGGGNSRQNGTANTGGGGGGGYFAGGAAGAGGSGIVIITYPTCTIVTTTTTSTSTTTTIPPTTTSTTTTIAPGACLTYRATNNGGGTAEVTYVNCYNVSGSINVGGGTFEDFCAKYNTPQSLGDVTFTILSGCTPPSTTTTSTTSTSTSTTSTSTSTSTSTTTSGWTSYPLVPSTSTSCTATGPSITAYRQEAGGGPLFIGAILYASENNEDYLPAGYYSDGTYNYTVGTFGIITFITSCSSTTTSTSTSTTTSGPTTTSTTSTTTEGPTTTSTSTTSTSTTSTSTSTTTVAPTCDTFRFVNNTVVEQIVYWTACNGIEFTKTLAGSETYYVCGLSGTAGEENPGDVTITDMGLCNLTTTTSTTTLAEWTGYNLYPVLSGIDCIPDGADFTAYKYFSPGSINNGDTLYASQNTGDPLVTGYYSDGGFRYEVNTGVVSNKAACPGATTTTTSTTSTSTSTTTAGPCDAMEFSFTPTGSNAWGNTGPMAVLTGSTHNYYIVPQRTGASFPQAFNYTAPGSTNLLTQQTWIVSSSTQPALTASVTWDNVLDTGGLLHSWMVTGSNCAGVSATSVVQVNTYSTL